MENDRNNKKQGQMSRIDSIAEKFKTLIRPAQKASQLKKRVVSSLILIPFAIYAVLFSKSLFIFFVVSMAVLMTFEWCDMTASRRNKNKWRLIGFLYIAIPAYCLVKIKLIDSDTLFWMFLVIWSVDIAAYFTGKIIGGPKLAPSISPGKTWSGFIGGVVAAIIVGFFTSLMFVGDVLFFIFISILISIICQISDLVESKFKRIFDVKDSGNLIPGHGGILDRMDGAILTAPFVLFVISFFGRQFGL